MVGVGGMIEEGSHGGVSFMQKEKEEGFGSLGLGLPFSLFVSLLKEEGDGEQEGRGRRGVLAIFLVCKKRRGTECG